MSERTGLSVSAAPPSLLSPFSAEDRLFSGREEATSITRPDFTLATSKAFFQVNKGWFFQFFHISLVNRPLSSSVDLK